MHLRTTARDCLYLNWALPLASAPPLPDPLRYEVHHTEGGDHIFASVLLFRLEGLRFRDLPFLRVSYPQMNLRLYVLDGDGIQAALFLRTLVPWWVVPFSYALGRQPAHSAALDFPAADEGSDPLAWDWQIRRGRELHLQARPGDPAMGDGPSLGSWESTVAYFRRRPRGYTLWENRLRSVQVSHPRVDVCPVAVEFSATGLLEESLDGVEPGRWHRPHSAWICPEIPFVFQLGQPMLLPLPARRVPATEGYFQRRGQGRDGGGLC